MALLKIRLFSVGGLVLGISKNRSVFTFWALDYENLKTEAL